MDDETAYMELVKSNSQGELSALEIGIHALGSVEKSQGKKGGGLKLHAGEIGKSNDSIEQWTKAASGRQATVPV